MSDDIVIKVQNLSKQYRIGSREGYKTFRETLVDAAKAPFQRLRSALTNISNTTNQTNSTNGTSRTNQTNYIWALIDVSFEVKRGEVIGIIGRNGAGKSTLLKILSQITEPTEGRVELRGRVGSLLEVGTGFHPELTGHENVYLYGAILGMDRWEVTRKFDEIVAFAELQKFIDTPVKRYSSGMYMRLAFAVAAHLEPEILLVDEVLAVGDIAFQKKCLGKMRDVSKEGRTVLFVSHNLEAVRKLCTQTMLLEQGRIESKGDTDQVLTQYLIRDESEVSAVVDLPLGSIDAPGRGISLCFFTQDGNLKAEFKLGEPWLIVLEFIVSRHTKHVIAAVGLKTIESVPIISYWSEPEDLAPGRYSVQFECDVPLKSCNLNFSVGLSSNERAFYYIDGIGYVSISEVAIEEQPVRASGGGLLFSSQKCMIKRIKSS